MVNHHDWTRIQSVCEERMGVVNGGEGESVVSGGGGDGCGEWRGRGWVW